MIRCFGKLLLLALLVAMCCIFIACQLFVEHAGSGKIYTTANAIPSREVGLVLGTARLRRGGGENLYFKKRIAAAAELYRRGKIKHLLLSGDDSNNEPGDMRKALLAQHVPARAMTLDRDGLRTLDSVVRAKEVFGLTHFTIISQQDHDERALLIARHYDINAIAFTAADVSFRHAVNAHVHEWFARVKVMLDLYILHTRPRHLGPKIALPIAQP